MIHSLLNSFPIERTFGVGFILIELASVAHRKWNVDVEILPWHSVLLPETETGSSPRDENRNFVIDQMHISRVSAELRFSTRGAWDTPRFLSSDANKVRRLSGSLRFFSDVIGNTRDNTSTYGKMRSRKGKGRGFAKRSAWFVDERRSLRADQAPLLVAKEIAAQISHSRAMKRYKMIRSRYRKQFCSGIVGNH